MNSGNPHAHGAASSGRSLNAGYTRPLLAVAIFALVLALTLLAVGWQQLGASRAQLDGERTLAGLRAPVDVERDDHGTVTVRAEDRFDQARAVGFVHAQERFFQMDLARRLAAGELAALLGQPAVEVDLRHRLHGLRDVAERALNAWPIEYRRLVGAYAAGVNAGLAALDGVPPEYRVLRTAPEPWRPEDSVLTVMAMYFALQDATGQRKRQRWAMEHTLPAPLVDFLLPGGSEWDAPVTGEAFRHGPPPGPAVFDLRRLPPEILPPLPDAQPVSVLPEGLPGSNNWAVAGPRAAGRGALVAVDMHLPLQVPGTWFRLQLERPDPRAAGETLWVGGLSLPGMPFIVAGANPHLAWGYTNSYGDWTEVTRLELDSAGERYRVPEGWAGLGIREETIEVRGGDKRTLEVEVSRHGPVLGELPDGSPFAVRWVAHEPRAHQPFTADLEGARTVGEALDIAARAGIPAQNFVVGDSAGNIGWTIKGRIPLRTTAASRSVREGPAPLPWAGWLPPQAHPRIENPPHGLLWTANSRAVGGPALAVIGDGGFDLGARTRQIRDRLLELPADATERDMLDIQLDDQARLLARWQPRVLALLETLAGEAGAAPVVAAARDAVADWGGHASVDSVGYRIVRSYRDRVIDWLARTLTAPTMARFPDFTYRELAAEAWAWPLLEAEPAHLLHPAFDDWRAFHQAALATVLEEIGNDLDGFTWGARNTVRTEHPMSGALPAPLRGWLNLPPVALPGDRDMPRVQASRFGASQRMAVAAGDLEGAILQVAGGQSGHPRSPFYGAGHQQWVEAGAEPLLPGAQRHGLRLVPGV